MNLWRLLRRGGSANEPEVAPAPPADPNDMAEARPEREMQEVTGERGIGSINRARSVQTRITQTLGIGLFALIGVGILAWYYSRALSAPEAERSQARALAAKAQTEMTLPPLGTLPQAVPTDQEADFEEQPPDDIPPAWLEPAQEEPVPERSAGPIPKSPEELILERRLSGAAFLRASDSDGGSSPSLDGAVTASTSATAASGSSLDGLLSPSVTPAVSARVLPTQQLLLPKGSFLDCTLETAISSSLPGMTTCITATDTFGADGTTVLLERGTKLVGETRGELRQGQSRLFVLWTEARTPTGVVIALASPGTDALGRSGVTGEVNRHFFERFGAAILVSVIDGVVRSAAQSEQSAVTINPDSSAQVMTEVLRSTANIPPTLHVAHGSRLQVLVARDLDFRTVYRLVSRAGGAR